MVFNLKVHDIESLSVDEQKYVQQFIQNYKDSRQKTKGPKFVVIAPGRVNLIGDHIDYNGYAVLPMAIEKCILMAVDFDNVVIENDAKHANKLEISNDDCKKYPSFSGEHSFGFGASLDSTTSWHNYILCGYHGVLAKKLLKVSSTEIVNHAKQLAADKTLLNAANKTLRDSLQSRNFTLFVASNLPAASGLSSSSALVCASAYATSLFATTSTANDGDDSESFLNSNSLLADQCSKFEWLIGTRGGGMDQAVIMTAQKGFAKYIEFDPILSCKNVELPANARWLVSHCGESHQKAAFSSYNKRVLETKLAAAIIANFASSSNKCHENISLKVIAINSSITLNKVQQSLRMNETQFADYLKRQVFVEQKSFSLAEICRLLNIGGGQSELFELLGIMNAELGNNDNNEAPQRLELYKRARHVVEEAARVKAFKKICRNSSKAEQIDKLNVATPQQQSAASDNDNDTLERLGSLMTKSHVSLRDLFEVSCESLDTLVDTALKAGAFGCRLTGAGFGGCVVSLVDESRKISVMQSLQKVSSSPSFTFETKPQVGIRAIAVHDAKSTRQQLS